MSAPADLNAFVTLAKKNAKEAPLVVRYKHRKVGGKTAWKSFEGEVRQSDQEEKAEYLTAAPSKDVGKTDLYQVPSPGFEYKDFVVEPLPESEEPKPVKQRQRSDSEVRRGQKPTANHAPAANDGSSKKNEENDELDLDEILQEVGDFDDENPGAGKTQERTSLHADSLKCALDSTTWPQVLKTNHDTETMKRRLREKFGQIRNFAIQDTLGAFLQLIDLAKSRPRICTESKFTAATRRMTKRLILASKRMHGVPAHQLQVLAEQLDDDELPEFVLRAEKRAALLLKATVGGGERGRGRGFTRGRGWFGRGIPHERWCTATAGDGKFLGAGNPRNNCNH